MTREEQTGMKTKPESMSARRLHKENGMKVSLMADSKCQKGGEGNLCFCPQHRQKKDEKKTTRGQAFLHLLDVFVTINHKSES